MDADLGRQYVILRASLIAYWLLLAVRTIFDAAPALGFYRGTFFAEPFISQFLDQVLSYNLQKEIAIGLMAEAVLAVSAWMLVYVTGKRESLAEIIGKFKRGEYFNGKA